MAKIITFKEIRLREADKTTWKFGAGASRMVPYDVPVQSQMLKYFCLLVCAERFKAGYKNE